MKNKSVLYLSILFIYIIVPFGVILLFKGNEWFGRTIGLTVVLFVSVPLIFFLTFSKKIELIKKDSKINRTPSLKKKKSGVILIIRSCIFIFGLGLLFLFVIPFIQDLRAISRKDVPVVVRQEIVQSTSPFGAWFLSQTIKLKADKGKNYYFLYSLKKRVTKNKTYKFLILPQSRLIVEIREN